MAGTDGRLRRVACQVFSLHLNIGRRHFSAEFEHLAGFSLEWLSGSNNWLPWVTCQVPMSLFDAKTSVKSCCESRVQPDCLMTSV